MPRSLIGRKFLANDSLLKSVITEWAQDADGKTINMDQYRGKVVLIINVASACGFTPQYKEQASLYDKYKDKGFVILGFPCNQAGLSLQPACML